MTPEEIRNMPYPTPPQNPLPLTNPHFGDGDNVTVLHKKALSQADPKTAKPDPNPLGQVNVPIPTPAQGSLPITNQCHNGDGDDI